MEQVSYSEVEYEREMDETFKQVWLFYFIHSFVVAAVAAAAAAAAVCFFFCVCAQIRNSPRAFTSYFRFYSGQIGGSRIK